MNNAEKTARLHEALVLKMEGGKLLCEAFDDIFGANAFQLIAVQRYDWLMEQKRLIDAQSRGGNTK